MKKLFIPILLLLTSCGSLGVTKEEKAAVEEVVILFGGGDYKYQKTVGFKNTSRNNVFKLELSGSPLFKTFAEDLKAPASGIAYNLYNQLGEAGNKYDTYQIVFKHDGGLTEYDFSTESIKDVEKYVPLLNQTLKQLESNSYEDIYEHIEHEDSNIVISLEDTKMLCDISDSLIGDVEKQHVFAYGYREFPEFNGQLLRLSAYVDGSNANRIFTIIVNPTNKKIVGLHIN